MALTDQPYLPLYIKDWLSNNKLKLASMGSHGLMVNIMCLMHKEETYGKLLLQQKYRQTDRQEINFATMLAKLLPFEKEEILKFLQELIESEILEIKDDFLVCKRMVKDAKLSETRASAGKIGAKKTNQKSSKNDIDFAAAKGPANTANAIANENVIANNSLIGKMLSEFKKQIPVYAADPDRDGKPLGEIANFINNQCKGVGDVSKNIEMILKEWQAICLVIKDDNFYNTKPLKTISNQIQEIFQITKNGRTSSNLKNNYGRRTEVAGTGGY